MWPFSAVDAHEVAVLKQTFADLSQRAGPVNCIDRATFLKVFPLPGLLGERLFDVFDTSKRGVIDFDGFICGLAVCCRGSYEEKVRFLFKMWDLSGCVGLGSA
jgi:Ca2+-binding EF-hand superfamily protein